MSKNRFDRPQRRQEEWKSDYTILTGGIDQSSSALAVKPGRLAGGYNVEELFGRQGYTFVKGYERFDGQARPSQADYAIQTFTDGTAAIAAGDTITNAADAQALVVSVTLTAGAWGSGTAAGTMLLTSRTSGWIATDPIRVAGVQRALAASATEVGSAAYADHQVAMTTVREYLRGRIGKPAGEGGILGGAVFNGVVYCVRNAVGGASATLWRSTAAGWVAVKTGLHAGGAYKLHAANFSGAVDRLGLFVVNGRSRLFQVLADDSVTFADPIWGSEATATDSVTIGMGTKNFTIAEPERDWVIGQDLTAWAVGDASKSMSGTITAYTAGTGALEMDVTSVTGAGTLDEWEFGRPDFSDKPYLLTEFKNHMFLAYPFGQLQTSNLGDPLVASTTAALFGVGQEINALVSLKGTALGIFCSGKIDVLRGSSSLDWDKGSYSRNAGAIAETTQENNGNALFLDSKGLTSLQATESFGDFENSIFSRDVKRDLNDRRGTEVGSRMAVGNSQYRLYFADGTNLRFTMLTGNPTVTPRDVSPSLSLYEHSPCCTFSGAMADGMERMFFGTTDGWLMEEDVGTSFDGAAIYYSVLLPFNHYKSPASDKQFHKLEMEMLCPDPLALHFRQLFDYEDGTFEYGAGRVDLRGEGGRFDVSQLDTFAFDMQSISRPETNIDGQGRNMALLLWAESDFVRPVTLQGLLTYFSMLGIRR